MKKRILGILSAAMVVLLSTPLAGCGGIKEKDADWVELSTWFFTSGVPNNVIEIVTDNEEAELLCTVKNEVLWGYNEQEFCKQVTLSNKDVKQTWWYKRSEDVFSCDYVDIVAKEGEHIVGYAVKKIEPTDIWYKAGIV